MTYNPSNSFFTISDDVITPRDIFIAWCGCGGVSGYITKALALADVTIDKYMMFQPNNNQTLKKYLDTNNYKSILPSLNRSTYAVIINPRTKTGMDLLYVEDKGALVRMNNRVYEPKTVYPNDIVSKQHEITDKILRDDLTEGIKEVINE